MTWHIPPKTRRDFKFLRARCISYSNQVLHHTASYVCSFERIADLVDCEQGGWAWQPDSKRRKPPLQARVDQEAPCRWVHTRNHLAQ